MLKTHKQSAASWEALLPEALHTVRSLLCTSTNSTPHERFLGFTRRSMIGKSLPSWLVQPGPVLLRRFVRNKSDPLVDEVELLEANPNFAKVRFPTGRESTVSVGDLAPCTSGADVGSKQTPPVSRSEQEQDRSITPPEPTTESPAKKGGTSTDDNPPRNETYFPETQAISTDSSLPPRRSSRIRKPPQRYGHNVYDT